jgi:hypothetical protein
MPDKPIKLSSAAKKLLALVPVDGDFIGNTTLQRRSKLRGNRYWKVRKELVGGGFLTRGKGRGGSVARLVTETDAPPILLKRGKLFARRESELYEPLKVWLDSEWGAGAEDGDFFEVRITGTARRKKRASGQWSRPDATLVQVNSYDYLPQPVLEVSTFEVKRFSDAENIRSVYEAAAHSRWAHFSYLVAEVPNGDYEFPDRFMSELERFKIGLILMWKDKDGWHFDEAESETDRLNPDPKELNVLLKGFFQDRKREREFKLAIGK